MALQTTFSSRRTSCPNLRSLDGLLNAGKESRGIPKSSAFESRVMLSRKADSLLEMGVSDGEVSRRELLTFLGNDWRFCP
jgi:hypothetical protein